jgi:hypothetical protein
MVSWIIRILSSPTVICIKCFRVQNRSFEIRKIEMTKNNKNIKIQPRFSGKFEKKYHFYTTSILSVFFCNVLKWKSRIKIRQGEYNIKQGKPSNSIKLIRGERICWIQFSKFEWSGISYWMLSYLLYIKRDNPTRLE